MYIATFFTFRPHRLAFLVHGRRLAVAPYKANAKELDKLYKQRTKYLLDLLEGVRTQPSAEPIHDLRVTARRLLTMLRVLPKSLRGSRKVRKYSLVLKSMLKTTTQIRDFEILEKILVSLEGALPAEILTGSKKKRSDAALRAEEELKSISVGTPSIGWAKIKNRKLSRKVNKRVEQNTQTVNTLLMQVTSDESKVDELHALRKEIKKLRYLMELSQKPPTPALTSWQNLLGDVHDLDVTIGFLERVRYSPPLDGALNELRRRRRSEYLKFVRDWERGLGLPDGVLHPSRPPTFTTP